MAQENEQKNISFEDVWGRRQAQISSPAKWLRPFVLPSSVYVTMKRTALTVSTGLCRL